MPTVDLFMHRMKFTIFLVTFKYVLIKYNVYSSHQLLISTFFLRTFTSSIVNICWCIATDYNIEIVLLRHI